MVPVISLSLAGGLDFLRPLGGGNCLTFALYTVLITFLNNGYKLIL